MYHCDKFGWLGIYKYRHNNIEKHLNNKMHGTKIQNIIISNFLTKKNNYYEAKSIDPLHWINYNHLKTVT